MTRKVRLAFFLSVLMLFLVALVGPRIADDIYYARLERKWREGPDSTLDITGTLSVDLGGTFVISSQSAEIIRMCWQTPVVCQCKCPTRTPEGGE